MIGPGKYDDLSTEARTKAKAEGVILLVFAHRTPRHDCQHRRDHTANVH